MLRAPVVFALVVGLHHVTNAMVTDDRQMMACETNEYCQLSLKEYGSSTLNVPGEHAYRISDSFLGLSKTVINADKILSKAHPIFIKLLSIFLLRILLKGSSPLELYMATATILHTGIYVSSTSTLPTATTRKYSRGECDAGWVQVNTSCYFPVNELMTFDHAERACSYHAANLLSISSDTQNALVFNIARDFLTDPGDVPVWIGMERANSLLRWVDSSHMDYTHWILGEPDGNGACVQMIRNGYWEDASCSQKLKFICKKPSSYPPPYSRTTELTILVGIPVAFSTIVIIVVVILVYKSIRDADGTLFGYGKNRNKEQLHAAIVNVSASIAHVKAQRGFSETDPESTRPQSPTESHNNNGLDDLEEPGTSTQSPNSRRNSQERIEIAQGSSADAEIGEQIEIQICGSAASIEQEPRGFQSTTSLDYLLSKSFITPKTRKLRGVRNIEATVRPPGRQGIYRKKDSLKKGNKST